MLGSLHPEPALKLCEMPAIRKIQRKWGGVDLRREFCGAWGSDEAVGQSYLSLHLDSVSKYKNEPVRKEFCMCRVNLNKATSSIQEIVNNRS